MPAGPDARSRCTPEIGIRARPAPRGARHLPVAPSPKSPLGAAVILLLRTGLSDARHEPTATEVASLMGYAAVMFAVCLLACVVPTRRALRVEPTEALRVE